MAIYHLSVKIIGRDSGRSAVGASAYRSGSKLRNDRDGVTHDYSKRGRGAVSAAAYRSGEKLRDGKTAHDFTRKSDIVYSEIMLPKYAPEKYQDRETLWNAVEKAEKAKNARTAREVEISLPNELTREQQIKLARDYIQRNFVNEGMCADFSIHAGHMHSRKDEIYPFQDLAVQKDNPHVHIQLTTRPIYENGEWGAKSRKEYILDRHGNRIKLPSGEWKSRKVNSTNWDDTKTLIKWREDWAMMVNREFARLGIDERISHQTLKARGIDREPTKPMGHEAFNLERKGVITAIGEENRAIMRRNAEKMPERTAQRLFEAQEKYFSLDYQISEIKAQISYDSMEARRLEICVEHMEESRDNIRNLRNCVADYEKQRRKLPFWESKKDVEDRIWHITNACGQAERYFENTYGDSVESFEGLKKEAEIEIEKLRTHERLQSAEIAALRPIHEESRHEYKKRKLLAEVREDYPEIKRHMEKLSAKEPPKSWEERQYRMVNEYRFDEISENEMWDIAKTLPDRQARQVRRKWEKDYSPPTVLYRRERVRERCR